MSRCKISRLLRYRTASATWLGLEIALSSKQSHLSEHVNSDEFFHVVVPINEIKEVKAGSVVFHNELEMGFVVAYVQQLDDIWMANFS